MKQKLAGRQAYSPAAVVPPKTRLSQRACIPSGTPVPSTSGIPQQRPRRADAPRDEIVQGESPWTGFSYLCLVCSAARSQASQQMSEGGLQGSLAGGALGATQQGLETSVSEYGGTPQAVRRVRYARADLGDMGREFLLQDGDMQRLPELPKEIVDSNMEKKFDEFFDTFRLADNEGRTCTWNAVRNV